MEDRNRNNEAGMMRRGGSGGAHGMYWPPASPEDKEVLIESRTVGGGAPSSKRVVTAFQQDKCTEDDGGGDVVVFEQSDLHSTTFPIMTDLRRNNLLCDVTIKLNDADWAFGAHRVILAATFPYFHAMFTHDMLESKQDVITIGTCGVEPTALEALLNFSYTGKLIINSANVRSLMLSAAFLQSNAVLSACAEYLMARLSAENVLDTEIFADSLGCTMLVTSCQKFIKKFFVQVVQSEDFLHLCLDKLSGLVSEDELDVNSEEAVFNAVLTWVKHDPEMRAEALPKLLSCVRMPLLTPQFLTDIIAPEPLIRKSMECRDLDAARDFHLMPERRTLLQSFRTKPRCCKEVAGVIYAVGGQTKSGNSLSTVEVFDPVIRRWRDAEAMSMLRSRVGVAVMKSRLYAIGGYNGTERLNTVEEFDADTKRWRKVASMKFKRSAVGAVAMGDYLYVCGGFDGTSSLNTVERYDPAEDSWTEVARMTKFRSAAGVVQLYGKIYALGGHNGLSIFESVECYDPSTGQWEESRSMLSKRCRLGVATLNGKIYACGGYDGSSFLKTVEMFDPVTKKWTQVASMNETRSRVALVANMGHLYAIGGYDGMKNLSSVERYDPVTNEWAQVAPMESHEGGVGVGVIPMDD